MSFFDFANYQWVKGEKNWHLPYNNALAALKDFLGDKLANSSLGGWLAYHDTEITNARQGKASLLANFQSKDQRLDVEHNADGTHMASASVAADFKTSGDTPTYVAATQFTVPGNKTATWVKGRRVKAVLSGGAVYGTVVASVYASATTVTLAESALDNTLSSVAYAIVAAGAAGSVSAHDHSSNEQGGGIPEIEINKGNIFRAFDELSELRGAALFMEKGWGDSFPAANGQGADEANSAGEQFDSANKQYKGADGGAGLNADFPFTTEADYIQQEWNNTLNSTSQATVAGGTAVTLTSGAFPVNCAKARISFDGGVAWHDISTRDSATALTLATSAANGTFNYIIRMTEFASGAVKLNEAGGGSYGSNIAPSATATAGTSGYPAADAIDSNTTSTGWTSNGATTGWFKLDFGAGNTKTVKQYRIVAWWHSASIRSPKTWTFEGGNDNSSWTVIETQTDITGWSNSETKTFNSFTNVTAYRYYRLNITANNGDTEVGFAEFEVMEAGSSCVTGEPVAVAPAFSKLAESAGWIDINSAAVTETLNSQTAKYFFIFSPASVSAYNDANLLVAVFNQTGNVWKKAARYNAGAWQYNSDTANTTEENWADAAVNDFLHAVAQALNTNVALSMTKADAEAVADAEFEQTGGFTAGTHAKCGLGVVLKSASATQSPSCDLLRVNYDAQRAAMDLRSKTYDPAFVPVEAYLWARVEHANADGPGAFYVTRDGGTTWTAITMAQQGNPITGNVRILRGTLDLTAQPSGQDLRCRYLTAQGKDQFLQAWGLQARPALTA